MTLRWIINPNLTDFYLTVVRSCSSHDFPRAPTENRTPFTSLFLQSTTLAFRMHKQLLAMMRRPEFGARVTGIRPRNLRRYSSELQLHVGINRRVLWRRNAQLFCHPHQLCQRSGPHLCMTPLRWILTGKFGGPQLSAICLLRRPLTTSPSTSRSRCVNKSHRARCSAISAWYFRFARSRAPFCPFCYICSS
jgi:hypothetical protein